MRSLPFGATVLWIVGTVLFGCGVGAGALRAWAAERRGGWIGWSYVAATGVALAAGFVISFLRWRRRAYPFAGDGPGLSVRGWLVASAVAGFGIGAFAGALQPLGSKTGPRLGLLVFFPIASLAAIVGSRLPSAVLRVLVLSAVFERAAQASYNMAVRGEWAEWPAITISSAVACGLAIAVALILAPFQRRIGAALARLRPAAPPAPDPSPRRA